jgi:NAD(P)-dependent dehydrogenase (short-subunit alcohol dehydrogenase family)
MEPRVVLITGATGGLGQAVAQTFAETEYRLALTARDKEALDALVHDHALSEERTLTKTADLTNGEEIDAMIEAIETHWGGVDILLNTVGGWSGGTRLGSVKEEDWRRVMALNLHSAFLIDHAVIPHMMDQGWGRIVNVASKAAEDPRSRQAAYNVAKAGVVALTASIAADYGDQGIVANAISPSIINTAGARANMPNADHSRWVPPKEIARLMLFLCRQESSSINGATIPIYGQV